MLNSFNNRYGRIIVSCHVLEDLETMRELFQNFVPLSIDLSRMFLDGTIEYTGYSQAFAQFAMDGAKVPIYRAVFTIDRESRKPKFNYFERTCI